MQFAVLQREKYYVHWKIRLKTEGNPYPKTEKAAKNGSLFTFFIYKSVTLASQQGPFRQEFQQQEQPPFCLYLYEWLWPCWPFCRR